MVDAPSNSMGNCNAPCGSAAGTEKAAVIPDGSEAAGSNPAPLHTASATFDLCDVVSVTRYAVYKGNVFLCELSREQAEELAKTNPQIAALFARHDNQPGVVQ